MSIPAIMLQTCATTLNRTTEAMKLVERRDDRSVVRAIDNVRTAITELERQLVRIEQRQKLLSTVSCVAPAVDCAN
jgi:hypothetical protein